MKKKLTLNTLAFANLTKRRKQYTIMIVSIVLAMVLSSSVVLFMFSSYETLLADNYDKYGCQDYIIYAYENSESVYEKSVEDGVLADYGLAHIIGYGYLSEDEKEYGAAIAWLDDKAAALSNQSLLEGAYPEKDGEIAIEQSALTRLGAEASLGDNITLSVRVQDNNKYRNTVQKTYTLVGILSDKRSNLTKYYGIDEFDETIPGAFVAAGTETEVGGLEKLAAYATEGENYVCETFYEDITDYVYESEICEVSAQSTTAFWDGVYEINSGSIYAVIVVIVLAFTSCTAIVNSFNSNLKERRKQIGMLRAVGTTRRQVINIFGREAFFICLICTPLSLAVSYAAVRIILGFLSDKPVMESSLWVLGLSAALCVAVTMLASLVPLLSAARITPIQAIRDIDANRKMKTKKIKSKKQFNVERHLAKRSVTFYKGAKVAVSIILAAVIIFTCYGFSYFAAIEFREDYYGSDYYIYSMSGTYYDSGQNIGLSGMNESELYQIKDCPYLTNVNAGKKIGVHVHIDEITDYFKAINDMNIWYDDELLENADNVTYENYADIAYGEISQYYTEYKNRYGYTGEYAACSLISQTDEAVESLEGSLTAGEIDARALSSGDEVVLVAPQTADFEIKFDEQGRLSTVSFCYDGDEALEGYHSVVSGECPFSVGDKITLSIIVYDSFEAYEKDTNDFRRIDKEVTIGAIVSPSAAQQNKYLNNITPVDDFAIMTTNSGMNAFCTGVKYNSVSADADEKIEMTDDVDSEIMAVLSPIADKYDTHYTSNYEENKQEKQNVTSMFAAMLALIIIGITIAGSIINNALTAAIREGKREIGTLRAVGASQKELVLSYVYRLGSMFGTGCTIGFGGFILSFITFFLITTKITKGVFEFTFSPWAAVVFCAVLFAICSFNLRSKIRREMKNSIVDNIREL